MDTKEDITHCNTFLIAFNRTGEKTSSGDPGVPWDLRRPERKADRQKEGVLVSCLVAGTKELTNSS